MRERDVILLVVEDDLLDRRLIERSFARRSIANERHYVGDGVEALDFLDAWLARPAEDRPGIVTLLDLNMPRMDGFEFLARLRADDRLKSLVVFVLTSSDTAEDVQRAYDHGIAGYLVKARAGPDLQDSVEMLRLYWRVVELPPGP